MQAKEQSGPGRHDRCRPALNPVDIMEVSDDCTGLDLLAKVQGRFEQGRVVRVSVIIRPRYGHKAGLALHALAAIGRAGWGQMAEMAQNAEQPIMADPNGL